MKKDGEERRWWEVESVLHGGRSEAEWQGFITALSFTAYRMIEFEFGCFL